MKFSRNILAVAASFIITACSTTAPPYQVDFNSVAKLKASKVAKVNVGEVTAQNKDIEKITLRGGKMSSPYGSYTEYLKQALTEQLKQANIFDGVSNTVISAEWIQNEVDASGFSTGEANMSAKFVVFKGDEEVYNKVQTTHHEWESSFVGAIAIPNAQVNYATSVQKLLSELFNDADFIKAIQ